MKTAIVSVADGSIANKYDGAPNQGNYGGPWGDSNQFIHSLIPGDLDERAIKATVADGSVTWAEDPALLKSAQIADKQAEITAAYNSLNSDVYGQMATVFGTTNPDSATAYNETWKLMNSNPSLFSNQGIVADRDIGDFHAGDALDTDQKVTDFSGALLALVNQYGVDRIKRIQQFTNQKNVILAEIAAIQAG